MVAEALRGMRVGPGGVWLDGTVGLGGHAEALLAASAPDGALYGVDRDARALEEARERLKPFGARVRLAQGHYAEAGRLFGFGAPVLNGALVDLGVSSLQLEDPARGFSFSREGPLDMRMDTSQGETARDFLLRATVEDVEVALRRAGEQRFAHRLAVLLKEGAPGWTSTTVAAEAVKRAVPGRGRAHPATRVFLALRMAVNREMEGLHDFLSRVPEWLLPGGRLAAITFHSTEDGTVKRFHDGVWKTSGRMRRVVKSPLAPSWEERRGNPRSRSAKLRVYEKI
jgi:16S rRNA (cytosine1402-N4)-methyltransferase